MKIKLDENLPGSLVNELQALGHDVDTVLSEHLAGRDDHEVWQAAQTAGRFLITQDLDPICVTSLPERTPDCCLCASQRPAEML